MGNYGCFWQPKWHRLSNSEQVVAVYDVKASGLRDMSLSAFTVEKQGSNTPEQYVTKMSLWNGATKLAEVANSTVAATGDGSNANADTTLILVTGATTAAGVPATVTLPCAPDTSDGAHWVSPSPTPTNALPAFWREIMFSTVAMKP